MTARTLCIAALLAACNDHPGFPSAAPDAGSADALPTTGDAAPGAVVVTVTLRGAPAPGVAVYFQNADSSLVLGATTDNHGAASAVLAAGGYVTVIEPDDGSGSTRLATFAAIRPGDMLHVDLAPTGPTDSTTFTATVPTMTGASGYQLYTSCGQLFVDPTGAVTGPLVGCGGTADILVMALDPTGAILGSLYAPGVPVGQPANLTGNYSALVATRFAYTGVPASSDAVRTVQTIATARGSLFQASASGAVTNGQLTNSLDMPAAAGAVAVTVGDVQAASTDLGEQRVFDWGAPAPTYALDLATAMLPPFVAAPTYDAAGRIVSWVEGTGGTTANVVRARVHAFRDAIPEGKSWTWAIVAPRSAGTSVTFPKFPPGGYDYTPQAGDSIYVDDLLIASVPLGYDGVRAHGFDNVQAYVTGPTGRLVVETLYSPLL
jgi:hypothetical protein